MWNGRKKLWDREENCWLIIKKRKQQVERSWVSGWVSAQVKKRLIWKDINQEKNRIEYIREKQVEMNP